MRLTRATVVQTWLMRSGANSIASERERCDGEAIDASASCRYSLSLASLPRPPPSKVPVREGVATFELKECLAGRATFRRSDAGSAQP